MRELDASLQQFGEFLLKARLVKEKAAPYCVRWVRRFLTRPASDEPVADQVRRFCEDLEREGRWEEWQVRQAEHALRIYFVNFLKRTDWQRTPAARRAKRGGWHVDIRLVLPDGQPYRQRKRIHASRTAARRWGEARERHLLQHGLPPRTKEVPTLAEFKDRFLDGYARANRQEPSGIAAKETVLRVHLAKAFGDNRLDEISTEDVQRLKAALTERAPKTVNNILTTLSVVLRTAVEWGVIAECPVRSSC